MNAAVARDTLILHRQPPQQTFATHRRSPTTQLLSRVVAPLIDATARKITDRLGNNSYFVKKFIEPRAHCKICLDARREQVIRERAAELHQTLFAMEPSGEIGFSRTGPLRNLYFPIIAEGNNITIGDLSVALESIVRHGFRGWKALPTTTKGLLTYCIMVAKNNCASM